MTKEQNQALKNFVILASVAGIAVCGIFFSKLLAPTGTSYSKKDLQALLEAQSSYMRVMAYHQAVAQMEQNYPIEDREMIPAERWENMLQKQTDNILLQFYQQQLVLEANTK
jgi:hypothetical protein